MATALATGSRVGGFEAGGSRVAGENGRLGDPPPPTLGNYPLYVSTEGCGDPSRDLVRLKALAVELLPKDDAKDRRAKRQHKCCRVPLPGATVDLLYDEATKKASFSGLMRCGNVWTCPVCASRITERKRVQVRQAVLRHEARSGRLVFVTFTHRHGIREPLSVNMTGFTKALRQIIQGNSYKAFKRRYGLKGFIRATEVTHGAAGWHVHAHFLLFVDGPVDCEQMHLDLFHRWQAKLKNQGLQSITERGVDVRHADMTAADYLVKFGHDRKWGVEAELTKGPVKRARKGNRTPLQLLADYGNGDVQAGQLWLEYALVFMRIPQLPWSTGLRAELGFDEPEKTDEELVMEAGKGPKKLLVSLTGEQWKYVIGNDAYTDLLRLAARTGGDRRQVLLFLFGLGCPLSCADMLDLREQAPELEART